MAIRYSHISSGAVVSGFNTTINPVAPAGAVGDLLLLFAYELIGSNTPPAVTGWTLISPNNAVHTAAVYARNATGSDAAAVAYGNQFAYASIERYRGSLTDLSAIVLTANDHQRTSINQILTTSSALSVAGTDGCMVIACGMRNKTSASDGATLSAFNGNFTTRMTNVVAGARVAAIFADWIQDTGTDVPVNLQSSSSIADATAQSYAGIVIVLLPTLNASGVGATGEAQRVVGAGGLVDIGTATTRQGETTVAAATSALIFSAVGHTAQAEQIVATALAPLPNAGSYAVTGGMDDSLDTASITFRATYGGATVDQTFILTKAKSGSAGNPGAGGTPGPPSIVLNVTRSSMMVLTYAEGTPVDPTFAGFDGYLTVLSGPTDVTAAASLSAITDGCDATVNVSDNVPVASQVKGYYRLSGLEQDDATITLYAFYMGYTFQTTVSIVKAKGGYEIVGSLPTTNIFDGRIVFLTADGKLYRAFMGLWTTAVPALDITGLLQSAQIASLDAAKLTGNLNTQQLASIDAAKITGQLTSAQILSSGQGACLSNDPYLADPTAWQARVTEGPLVAFGANYINGMISGTTFGIAGALADLLHPMTYTLEGVHGVPANAAKSYRISAYIYNEAADGTCYIRIWQHDTDDLDDIQTTMSGLEGFSVPNDGAWHKYAGFFTGVSPLMVPSVILNYGGSTGRMLIQDLRIEEVIGGDMIVAGGITAANLAAGSITAVAIAAGSVTSAAIAANTIVAADIAAGTITTTELAAGSVTTAKIAAGTILASNIAAATITGNKIAANTIVAGNLLANTITANELSLGALITATAQITDGIIISAKIGNLQVNSANIADLTVGTGKIAPNAVSTLVSAEFGSTAITSLLTWTTVATLDIVHTGVTPLPDIVLNGLINIQCTSAGTIQFHMRVVYTDATTSAALGTKNYFGLWSPAGGGDWYGIQTQNHPVFDILPNPGARTVRATLQVQVNNTNATVNGAILSMQEVRR